MGQLLCGSTSIRPSFSRLYLNPLVLGKYSVMQPVAAPGPCPTPGHWQYRWESIFIIRRSNYPRRQRAGLLPGMASLGSG